ncbi:hypothetical protein DL764_001789 [Monosporascus ibericus]|uniref:FAD-binding PCMH-type domain-containing protein n=1 Tax=Monosporascus ibericus TaxID=155417 RepID=A0A4Q4TN66_9PEZI|nr:hypothetical protein DL764_001789 [Monosporascus ibericus]
MAHSKYILAALLSLGTAETPSLADTRTPPPDSAIAAGCSALTRSLPSQVFLPGSSVYDYEVGNLWSNTQIRRPACIVRPTSARNVSTAVRESRATGTRFAVRAGGHMAVPGANSIDDGILVVMSNLTRISIAPDRASVDVGPGLTWEDVYAYLIDFERTAVGGRIAPIGVAGLTLGGGIGFQGNARGWAADNVIEYEVVLASGKVVVANETSNADLFWALKGGGANFGIVTNFKLRTAPSTKVLAGIYTIDGSHMDALITAAADYASYNTDPLSHILPLVEIVNQTTTIGLVLFYDSATEANPACLDQFFAIPATNSTVAFKTLAEFVVERNSFSIPDINDVLFAGTVVGGNGGDVRAAIQLTHDVFYGKLPDLYAAVPPAALEYVSIGWQPVPGLWLEASRRANPGGNPLGLGLSSSSAVGGEEGKVYIAWVGIVMWKEARYDDAVGRWIRDVADAINGAARESGLYDPFVYMGDAAGFQDVFAGYGAKNRERLLRVSREYDPDRVFQTLMPGGFKIGL